ncbi:MAG: hypothetical protein IPO66_15670 [Rhodanobacteraceae bacterium]|nr:hypothetical protein [Rhodanobacteraceae bacterium]
MVRQKAQSDLAVASHCQIDPAVSASLVRFLVALGTSMPELATTLVAVFRGNDEVGVGTLLGSNVFNGLFVVGIAAVVTPIPIAGPTLWIALVATVIAVAAVWPGKTQILGRGRGVLLIVIYALMMALLAVFAS